MSLRSLGNNSGIYLTRFTVACFAFILLSPVLCIKAHAEPSEDRRSGVVSPTITRLSPVEASSKPTIIDYRFPTRYSEPSGLAIDEKGRIWVTEVNGNSLAMFDPATNELKEYRIPSTVGLPDIKWEYDIRHKTTPERAINVHSVGSPGNVIVSRSGIVWFVLQMGNSIVRFDPEKEEFIELPIASKDSRPYDLAEDSKGGIWFVEKNAGKLGYMNFDKKRSLEMNIGTGSHMMGIAIDKDDHVWFGNIGGNYIGRYNPETKKLRKYPISVPLSQPGMMRFDKNGLLWISNLHARQLGVLMTASGIYSVVDLPGYNSVPQALGHSDNNNVWVVDSMTNKISSFNSVTLKWRVFNIPTANSQPMMVALDKKGDVWFTQSGRHANKISKLVASTVPADEDTSVTIQTKANSLFGKDDFRLYIITALIFVVLASGFILVRRIRQT